MDNQDDIETLKRARPYLRTLMAFLLKMRYPIATFEDHYKTTDKYLDQLNRDVKESSRG